MLYYYRFEYIWQRSIVFCLIWGYIDWTFYILQTILFAWATIERHILIFHEHLVSTRKKRFFFHYLPISILILYILIFYIIVYFFPSCENIYIYDNGDMRCIYFCINVDDQFNIGEIIAHQIIPGFIIIVFSCILFIRIIWKQAHIRRQIQWRKYRKMAIQIFVISLNYILFYFPYIFLNVMYLCGRYYELSEDVRDFLDFLSYFMMLFLPFVCTLTLPDFSRRMKSFIRCTRRPRHIAPMTIATK